MTGPDTAETHFELIGPFEPAADDYESYGGDGYRLRALCRASELGYLELAVVDDLEDGDSYDVFDAIHIHWVEVVAGCRRQGVATALIAEARRRWPRRELHTSGLTDDGEAFWAALQR